MTKNEGKNKLPKLKREIFEIEGRFSLLVEYADNLTAREKRLIDSFLGYASNSVNARWGKLAKDEAQPMTNELVKASGGSKKAATVPDELVWAVCPHIRRWSDGNWNEYALEQQVCDRCADSETIDGHNLACPWRCDAEEAAKAVAEARARAE